MIRGFFDDKNQYERNLLRSEAYHYNVKKYSGFFRDVTDSCLGSYRFSTSGKGGGRGGKGGKRSVDSRHQKQFLCSPVNSLGFPALRSFLFAPGEDVGEFFFRVCTLGGAAGHEERKRLKN